MCTSSHTHTTHRVTLFTKIVNEYDQEIPQSQTADNKTKLQIFRQPQISFHLRKINICFHNLVSFVHAHINPLDIEMFDVSLTCMVCNL